MDRKLVEALVVGALLLAPGCASEIPTEPVATPSPAPAVQTPSELLGLPLLPLGGGEEPIRLVRVREGARLTAADVILSLLPGSLREPVDISIEPEDTGYVSFLFGPRGLVFQRPALLAISTAKADLRGIDPRRLRIAVASDDAEDWRIVGGLYIPLTRTVVAPVFHFSRYALCVN